jgi:hypothetical protein
MPRKHVRFRPEAELTMSASEVRQVPIADTGSTQSRTHSGGGEQFAGLDSSSVAYNPHMRAEAVMKEAPDVRATFSRKKALLASPTIGVRSGEITPQAYPTEEDQNNQECDDRYRPVGEFPSDPCGSSVEDQEHKRENRKE